MSGSRHERFSDATRRKALQIVEKNTEISARQLADEARRLGFYKPQADCIHPLHRRALWFGRRIMQELLQDGLVKRSQYSVKWGHETRYSLTPRGTALLDLGKDRKAKD